MFLKFFESLRKHGIHVTLGEWLDLENALDSGLIGGQLSRFYHGARMILVKSETDYDKYDEAFEECFSAVKKDTEIGKEMLRWLDKSDMMQLAEMEAKDHLNKMEGEGIIIDKEDVFVFEQFGTDDLEKVLDIFLALQHRQVRL